MHRTHFKNIKNIVCSLETLEVRSGRSVTYTTAARETIRDEFEFEFLRFSVTLVGSSFKEAWSANGFQWCN